MPVNVLQAVRVGDMDLLKKLIAEGYPVDIKDNNGWSPLHEAASRNNLECLKLLISHDCLEINSVSFDNRTPLFLCASNNYLKCLKYLLANGANPNICDHMGRSAMHSAASNGNSAMIVELLKSNAEIDVQMYDGSTPLHEAVEKNQPIAVEQLVESGANVNICDENGLWPFFLSAYLGLGDCLKVFLKVFQESMKPSEIASIVNIPKEDGCTPLFAAAQAGQIDCVKLLLESGANANILIENTKALPLHIALWKNHTEIVRTLLPLTYREVLNKCECSPFLYALNDVGDVTAFDLLIEHGYSVSTPSASPIKIEHFLYDLFPVFEDLLMTPLTYAILQESSSIFIDLILEKQRDFHSFEENEFPPLLAALSKNSLPLASDIISKWNKINIYLSPFPFNMSLIVAHTEDTLKFVIAMGAEVESLFYDDSITIMREILAKVEGNTKHHLEMVLCQSFYNGQKGAFPLELASLFSSKGQNMVSQIPSVKSLQELCRGVIRPFFSLNDFLNNLECLRGVIPDLLINFLLRVDMIPQIQIV